VDALEFAPLKRAQALDLVFQTQLLLLQRTEFQVVRSRMHQFLLKLGLECVMAALEFGEMALLRHA
jgi:hypothetical protein